MSHESDVWVAFVTILKRYQVKLSGERDALSALTKTERMTPNKLCPPVLLVLAASLTGARFWKHSSHEALPQYQHLAHPEHLP